MNRLVPIGFFPKDTTVPADWTDSDSVSEICSVSHCVTSGPEDWIDHWLHNDFGYYNSEQDALAICGDKAASFHLMAFRMLPAMFKDGLLLDFEVPDFPITQISDHYVQLGFDVSNATLGKSGFPFLECSPLSCNGFAKEIQVNQFCLVDTLESAIQLAKKVSVGGAEPGPYFVVEVLRSMQHRHSLNKRLPIE